jgi:hypothetical protein
MAPPICAFTGTPLLPPELERQRALVYKLRWAWNSEIRAQAKVSLGALTPDDVSVELYVGLVNADGEITEARAIPMLPAGDGGA